MKGVILIDFRAGGNVVIGYPEGLAEENIGKIKKILSEGNLNYKSQQVVKVEETLYYSIFPVLIKRKDSDRGEPGLLIFICENQNEAHKALFIIEKMGIKDLEFKRDKLKELNDKVSKLLEEKESIIEKMLMKEKFMW